MIECLAYQEINWWELTKDIVTVATPIFAIIIAYTGLSTWKRSLKGTNKYKTAIAALKASYAVRDSIIRLRKSTYAICGSKDKQGKEIFEYEEKNIRAGLEDLDDKLVELQVVINESVIFWGDEASDHFKNLNALVKELKGNVKSYKHEKRNFLYSDEQTDNSCKITPEIKSVISFISEDDEKSNELNNIIASIEIFYLNKLKNEL